MPAYIDIPFFFSRCVVFYCTESAVYLTSPFIEEHCFSFFPCHCTIINNGPMNGAPLYPCVNISVANIKGQRYKHFKKSKIYIQTTIQNHLIYASINKIHNCF